MPAYMDPRMDLDSYKETICLHHTRSMISSTACIVVASSCYDYYDASSSYVEHFSSIALLVDAKD